MVFPEYFADVAKELARKSAAIRRDFATHHLSAGENREGEVGRILEGLFPNRFGISTGLVLSHDGLFSNQSDLIVVDHENNVPLYPESRNKIWPVESVYALIEVKTQLGPRDLQDAIQKGRKFKVLPRRFVNPYGEISLQRIRTSLFVIWAFESPSPTTVKENLISALVDVPSQQRPDFVVVPDTLMAQSGQYMELARLGQPNSPHRQKLESIHGSDFTSLIPEPVEVYDLKEYSLLAWYIWFDSWLRFAGPRFSDPKSYLPDQMIFGRKV